MSAPQVNGPSAADPSGKYIDTIDPDDPEYIKSMIRPAEVKEDVAQMEERKRVSMVLHSQQFRKELEEIAIDQIKNGPSPAGLLALQQISELLVPRGGAFSGQAGTAAKVAAKVIPIADIRGTDTMNYNKGEKLLRCKFASLYRLIDISGWSASIYSYITCRLSQDFEHFLMIPYGMLYHEVTAASLVKVDMAGELLDPGTTGLGVNRAGFGLHAAVHAARPDVKCIVHLRNPAAVSVSSMDVGLMALCQEAVTVGEVSVADYDGCLPDQDAKDKLTRALGPNNKVLMLRNNGFLLGGESIDEAFLLANNVMAAVETQLQALPIGVDRLVLPSAESCRNLKKAYDAAHQQPEDGTHDEQGRRKWRKGEREFESYMRHLDNAGYRTGHVYHEPLLRNNQKRDRINSEVEVPPSATSFATMYEDGDKARIREEEVDAVTQALLQSSPLKQHFDKQKKAFKTDWLNTPNSYKKEEFKETGTPNPKKITKWVTEPSPGKTPPVKVENNPNQFAPQGVNPKEFKLKFKEIKKEYYDETISAGPQSRILEGVTWEEAQKIKDGHVSGTTDSVIVVGAASKGIIQRDHQHNAVVYKTYYAPNPFDSMTEDEIEKYKQEVAGSGEKVAEGGAGEPASEEIVPGPDGKLISTEQRMQQVRSTEPVTTIQVTESGVNGEQLASPSSGADDRSSREGSPAKDTLSPEQGSPTKDKKKKKFRMPSFSKKKDKKEKK